MTVSTTTSSVSYSANGTQTTFAYTFKIFEDGDLLVILRNNTTGVEMTQSLTTDYTVTNAGNDLGGNVVFGTAPADGNTVFIRRSLPITQLTDYVENDPFPAESHEDALDKLTMLIQQGALDEDRAILFPESDAGSGLNNILPSSVARASSFLTFDGGGNVTVTSVSDPGAPSTITKQNFIGDGATVAFTLAADPGGAGTGVSIYIDGVYQNRDTYSISGTSLIFTEAPPLNASIEYLSYRITNIGATTADAVTYTPSGTGAEARSVANKLGEFVSVKDFGAVGDASTDDTAAIDAALSASNKVHFPAGVYVYTGTLTLPEACRISGEGNPKLATFPQANGDKALLRPGFKDQMPGSTILFTGTGSTSSVTTNRSDRFASVTPMIKYIGQSALDIQDIGFIQNMDVLDAGGSLTTSSTDNRATAYTGGMFIATSTLSSFTRMTLFGYFDDAGLIIYSGTDLASSLNPDYNTFVNCLISGGTAIIGHDTAAGASDQGLTGQRFIGCGLYAFDHHTRADGNFNIPAIYIDSFLTGVTAKIRGHAFVGSNVRCYADDAIVLDHADDIQFSSCTWEFPQLAGVSGASNAGGFVGTSNTGDLWVFGGAGTSQPKITDFIQQTSGKWVFAGGGHFDGFMVGEGDHGVRLSGDAGDSVVQLTDDFSSVTTGWSIRRDSSAADKFDVRYEGTSKFAFTTDGEISSNFGFAVGATQTIASGAITKPTGSYFLIDTEGGAASDDLTTINGASFDGEIIIVRAANASRTVVAKDGGGNLRLAGDFSLDNSQDRLMLMYDGTNWCEVSRSNNTA